MKTFTVKDIENIAEVARSKGRMDEADVIEYLLLLVRSSFSMAFAPNLTEADSTVKTWSLSETSQKSHTLRDASSSYTDTELQAALIDTVRATQITFPRVRPGIPSHKVEQRNNGSGILYYSENASSIVDQNIPEEVSRKQPPLLTSTQAGEMLNVSAQTIKNWVNDGKLFGYRIGNRVMIPRAVTEAYLRGAVIRPKVNPQVDEDWEMSDDEAVEAVRRDRHN